MIEKWNVSRIYERYYNECQPAQCNYTVETRNDIVYIVTTLFGIAGGLTTVLKLVVPHMVKFIMHCIQKLSRRVVPQVFVVQTELLP
jgi:transcriptional regulator CtsR